jgi:hypothetical protein
MEESRRREVHAKSEDHIGSKVTVVSLRAAAIDHASGRINARGLIGG